MSRPELFIVQHQRAAQRIAPIEAITDADPLASTPCILCDRLLLPGQRLVRVVLGPGDDQDERRAHIAGEWYDAQAIAGHRDCFSPTGTDRGHLRLTRAGRDEAPLLER